MSRVRFSIRHRLLILGAVATASIWMGALLQYLQLRSQSTQLTAVRVDLATATRYAQAARLAARERGLSNGWLSQTVGTSPAELAVVRERLDDGVAGLSAPPPAVSARVEQLPQVRAEIDRRELVAVDAFNFYTAMIAAVLDSAAARLASGMIAVGLPYEHVNNLQRTAELLAQMRGTTNGALRAGQLQPQTEATLARILVLYDESLHLYERSVPDASRVQLAAALDAPAVHSTVDRVRKLLATHSLGAVGLDAAGWWALATQAVDLLQQAAERESASMATRADQRIDALEQRLRWTVAALVILGVVTIVLVLSTVGRIVRGLDRLLEGLDTVGDRRNFNARIDESSRDEFGTISGGINRLIAIAGSVVDEQEMLSLTDPLTGAVNRRGFDQQLAARTTTARAHTVPLSVVIIDIDHFKSVNDTLGHASGDAVLKGLVLVLSKVLRPDDVLARFGGEEFVALLPGCPLDHALHVAEKMRAAIEAADFHIGRTVTASFGVVQWMRTQTPADVLAAADACLYAAKAAGRNRVRSPA